MTVSYDPNHVLEANALLLAQFIDKPNFLAFLQSYINRIQELENAIYAVFWQRLIANASGVQLDGLGQIVGQARNGLADTDYRTLLFVRIRLNYSSGLMQDITDVCALFLQTSPPPIVLTEAPPAAFLLQLLGFSPAQATTLASVVMQARGAAINLQLEYETTTHTSMLVFCNSSSPVTGSTSQGYASSSGASGGQIAGVIQA